VRISDRIAVSLMHHTARWTVRYGEGLRFAGSDLPRPTRLRVPTRRGAVTAWSYTPPGWSEGGPTHVHLHGGAWLMRHPSMDDWWCRYLAATAGVRVLNVDFHVAPYAVFPTAQEEAHDVAAWAAGQGPVSVGGFSSGGGTAAAVCLMARDEQTFTPRLQVLGVPALDLASDLPSGSGQISPSLRALVRRAYFPDAASRLSSYASPLLATSLAGLPRALVMTAERDTLRRDGDEYAVRLREAGVEVWHDVTPGADHYFLTEDPLRARATMAHVAAEVRAALA
jgi:acetyl esterase